MDKATKLKQEIVNIVTKFEADQMRITPDLISVVLEPGLLIVTLRGVASQAEKDLAKRQEGRVLLKDLYHRVFDAVKQILEMNIEATLQRRIERSRLDIDPESGNGVLLFDLADEAASAPKQTKKREEAS